MTGRAWGSAFAVSSLFWVSLFLFHYAGGQSWPLSVLLAFSGMVAGALLAAGVSEAIARKGPRK